MRLGMIARADNGGLGNLTWEFARHLRPARILVQDLGDAGRSAIHPERYDDLGGDVRISHGWGPTREERDWLLTDVDVVYSAECWYDDELPGHARARGVRTVLHVMPELWRPERIADELWVPTTYRRDKIPVATRLVPVPVALDRFTAEPRTPATHFVHQWAPAMLDRNGTFPTLAALELIDVPVRFTILGAQRNVQLSAGSPVTLDLRPTFDGPYWQVWPDDGDVLVLPRRFAGLSMPVQEAAARAMPSIMTDADPQREWPIIRVPSRGREFAVMAGGKVPVHDPDPAAIARAVRRLATDEEHARASSAAARRWAEGISWDSWRDRYERLLDDAV